MKNRKQYGAKGETKCVEEMVALIQQSIIPLSVKQSPRTSSRGSKLLGLEGKTIAIV